uniref:Lipoxygenase domain-containing protein n=1 Tax=Sander lucioperca TaxID=283035 RepID=A0A8C9ZZQ7_SANLU
MYNHFYFFFLVLLQLISCPVSIGKLVLIELDKQCLPLFPEDTWFPTKVEVKSPEGDTYNFPIYRWITDSEVHRFREGTALRVFEDNHHLGRYKLRKTHFYFMHSKTNMPPNLFHLWLIYYIHVKFTSVHFSDYVHEHWKEDAFFGYQYLNGLNPMLIRRCSALPDNFAVTDDMVSLHGQGSLRNEMKKGNIFLCDYKRLDGVKANIINLKKQYLMAPLVLLHKTPDDKLMPVAIQVRLTSLMIEDQLILCSDLGFNENMNFLLRNQLTEYVTNRVPSFPQLLIPYTRYTLQINYLARSLLISETGVFTQFAASGGEGMMTILKRSLSSMRYSSLCLPDDIAERGVEAVPNFYYRDDGLKLWDIIQRFVQGVLSFYYKNDAEVQKDSELQKWISDIFEHGFLSQARIPQSFTTVAELVKFVTMVIFTCSGQHSAVNTGQYDYGSWMPNTPISLQLPPPTTKGKTSKATMLKQSSDFVPLGQYPEDHFSEKIPCKLIKDFQGELEGLSVVIKARNKKLEVPYTYMDPRELENSVAI